MTNFLKPLKPIEINFELDLVKQNERRLYEKVSFSDWYFINLSIKC